MSIFRKKGVAIAVMVLCKIYIGLYDRRRKEKKHDR